MIHNRVVVPRSVGSPRSPASQFKKLSAKSIALQKSAAHDRCGRLWLFVHYPAPMHAEVVRLHHDRQAIRSKTPFKLVRQHHHCFFLDLRPVHDPVANASKFGQSNQFRVYVGQNPEPDLSKDRAQMVRTGTPHSDRPYDHQFVQACNVGKARERGG